MRTHYFAIVADGPDPDDAVVDAFHEAGCRDASISWSDGLFTLSFHREAERFDEALLSAYRDVTKGGGTVNRFEPDSLVTLDDIAERSELDAAIIAHLRDSADEPVFPSPSVRVTSQEPLWDWAAVAMWLQRRQLVSREIAMEARIIWEANTTLLLRAAQGADFEQAFGGLRLSAD